MKLKKLTTLEAIKEIQDDINKIFTSRGGYIIGIDVDDFEEPIVWLDSEFTYQGDFILTKEVLLIDDWVEFDKCNNYLIFEDLEVGKIYNVVGDDIDYTLILGEIFILHEDGSWRESIYQKDEFLHKLKWVEKV